MTRILGLDLSMSCSGFAVVDVVKGKPKLMYKSYVKTNAKYTHGQRLIAIEQRLLKLLDDYGQFDAVVREKGFSLHAMTTQVIFKVVGVSDLTLAKQGYAKVTEVSPTTVKKHVAGNGKASKADVKNAVHKYVDPNLEITFKADDESDAVAVALTYALQNKLIKGV